MGASSRRAQRDAVIQRFVKASRWVGIALVGTIGFLELGNYFKWFRLQDLVAAATWGVVILTAVDSAWGLARVKSREAQQKHDEQLRKTLTGVALEVSRLADIKVEFIGVTLWLVERPSALARALARATRRESSPDTLVRVATVRLSGHPPPTHYEWTRGRGVIGACWKRCAKEYRDFGKLQERYPESRELTNTQWKSAQASATGFERHEFLRFIHKYQQILAMPMTDAEGRFLGCISIDLPTGRSSPNSLDTIEVQEQAAQACLTLRGQFE